MKKFRHGFYDEQITSTEILLLDKFFFDLNYASVDATMKLFWDVSRFL